MVQGSGCIIPIPSELPQLSEAVVGKASMYVHSVRGGQLTAGRLPAGCIVGAGVCVFE